MTNERDIFDIDNPQHQKLIPNFMNAMRSSVDQFKTNTLFPFIQKHGKIPYKLQQEPKRRFREPAFSMVMSNFNDATIDQELLEVVWETQSNNPASFQTGLNDDRQVALDLLMPLAGMECEQYNQTPEELAFYWFYCQSTDYFEYQCNLAIVEFSDVVDYLNKNNNPDKPFTFEMGFHDLVAVVIPDRKMAMTVKMLF